MKWGILGTGVIAKKFATTVVSMNDENEVPAAVGSRSLESAQAFAQEYGFHNAYGSYEELAAAPDVDAVYVATPNSLHYENVKLCLTAGKNVLCEKPFTITTDQAAELYALAKEKGLFLMEGLWIRFLPLYAALRAVIADGTVGEVKRISALYGFEADGAKRVRKFRSDLGGGALLDIGVYTMGFAGIVTGERPVSFVSDVRMNEFGTDEYSRITLTYPCGAEAVAVQTIGEKLPREAWVFGTNGSIYLPDYQAAERMTVRAGTLEQTYDFPFEVNGFEYQIREFSRCVTAGLAESPLYTAEDSLAMMRLLEDIRESWGMRFACE